MPFFKTGVPTKCRVENFKKLALRSISRFLEVPKFTNVTN